MITTRKNTINIHKYSEQLAGTGLQTNTQNPW